MKRSDVVDALKRASPGLASKDLVPAFSCFFFKDGNVMAYDDIVAVSTPLPMDVFQGGLSGKLLMDFLAASRASDLELKMESESELVIKAGRAKLNIPVVDLDEFLFTWPEEKGHEIEVSDNLFAAIKAASQNMGLDPSVPWRMGITLQLEDGSATLYSSDNYSVTEATVKAKLPKKLDGLLTILPPKFVELVVAKGKPKSMIMTTDWIEAAYDDATRIFSRTLSDAAPQNFAKVMQSVAWDDVTCEIPKGFDECLRRSLVVLGAADDQHMDMYVAQGKLRFMTKGPVAEARDYLKWPKHGDATTRVRPALLARAHAFSDKMMIVPSTLVAFRGEGIKHVVAASTEG